MSDDAARDEAPDEAPDDQAGSDQAKQTLQRYLQHAREAVVWKTEGLSERELRLPRTPTGTNLLGLVKHCLSVEIGYFGPTFGRAWPDPQEVPWMAVWTDEDAADEDPQADLYATATESAEQLVALYRRVWDFADATIAELSLGARGRVPWWGEHGDVTLHTVLVHVVAELNRHAGHADIVREGVDGAAGLSTRNANLPDGWEAEQFAAYRARLTEIAEHFPA